MAESVIVGWKFQQIEENGDTAEWWRELHLESPIYTTSAAAHEAIIVVKKSMLETCKKDMNAYISMQMKYEIKNGRSVNDFLCRCQQCKMTRYRDILARMRSVNVVPVFAYTEPTHFYNEYSIAD